MKWNRSLAHKYAHACVCARVFACLKFLYSNLNCSSTYVPVRQADFNTLILRQGDRDNATETVNRKTLMIMSTSVNSIAFLP